MSNIKGKIKKLWINADKKYRQVFYGGCTVLLYHRVTDLDTDPQLLSVSPANFDAQIAFLKNNYNLLKIEQFKEHLLNKKRFPANSVLITFDDGYADNLLEALPILEKHQAQALFYISTGTLNTENEYWWDAVERIVLLSKGTPVNDTYTLRGKSYDLKGLDKAKREELYNALLPELRTMVSAEREQKLAELAAIMNAETPRKTHRAMTFEELKKMSVSESAVVGAHTHLHPSLGSLNYDEQYREIETSKKILEEKLSQKITHFSYPFGTRKDFNQDSIAIVKKLEFECVAANIPEPVNALSDRYAFTRFLVRNWGLNEFKKQLKSFC